MDTVDRLQFCNWLNTKINILLVYMDLVLFTDLFSFCNFAQNNTTGTDRKYS